MFSAKSLNNYNQYLLGIRQRGHKQSNDVYFDTLHVVPTNDHNASDIKARAQAKKINLRYFDDGAVGVALDETTTMQDVDDLLWIFDCQSVNEVSFVTILVIYNFKLTSNLYENGEFCFPRYRREM